MLQKGQPQSVIAFDTREKTEKSLSDVEASLTVKPPHNNLLMINLVGYIRLHCSPRKTIKTEPLDIQKMKSNGILQATEEGKHPTICRPRLSKIKLLRNRSITTKMLRRHPQQEQEDLNDDQAEVTDINLQNLDAGKLNEKVQQLPGATNKRQQKFERSESQECQRLNKQKAKVSQPGTSRNATPKQKTTNHQREQGANQNCTAPDQDTGNSTANLLQKYDCQKSTKCEEQRAR